MKRQRDLGKKQKLIGISFVLPSILGLSLFFIVPFFISIVLSFSDTAGSFHFSGFAQYVDLIKSKAFLLAAKNTLLFVIAGVPVLLLLSLCIAILMRTLFQEKAAGRNALFAISLLPMVLPSSVVVLLLRLLLDKNGIINTAFNGSIDFYRAPYIFWILLILYLWRNTAYGMVIFFTGLRAIPPELYEQASLDGARKSQILRKIALPLLMPSILFNIIIATMGVFKLFRESHLLLGAYPDSTVYMLQNFMNNNFYSLNYTRLSVASVLFSTVLGIGLIFMLRTLRDKNAM